MKYTDDVTFERDLIQCCNTEQLQALPGRWPIFVQEMQIKFLDKGFGTLLPRNAPRSRDFHSLATMFFLICRHSEDEPYQAPRAPALREWLQSSQPSPREYRTRLQEILRVFDKLVQEKKYSRPFQKLSPNEFSIAGVLIFVHYEELSLMQLSTAMTLVTAAGAKRRGDKQLEAMFEFITKHLRTRDLGSDGDGDRPAAVVIRASSRIQKTRTRRKCNNDSNVEAARLGPKIKPPGCKRNRKALGASDEEDEEGQSREPSPGPSSTSCAKRRRKNSNASVTDLSVPSRSQLSAPSRTATSKQAPKGPFPPSKFPYSWSQKKRVADDEGKEDDTHMTPSVSKRRKRRRMSDSEDEWTPTPKAAKRHSAKGRARVLQAESDDGGEHSVRRPNFSKVGAAEGQKGRTGTALVPVRLFFFSYVSQCSENTSGAFDS